MTDANGSVPATQALADLATDEDKLFNDGYVKGIARYIKECATPMTIAIQGDWGAGKTSLINLIEAELHAEAEPGEGADGNAQGYCKDIINVEIVDAWRDSVANPRVSLIEDLLNDVISKLSGSNLETMKKASEFASATSEVVNVLSDGEEKSDDGFSLGSLIDSIFGIEEKPRTEKGEPIVSGNEIDEFKRMFAEGLQQTAEKNGKSENSRFVVFVDGLDHISPEATINFMEQIRTYMNCLRCVFVLAVDQQQVFDGIRKKLGDKVDERQKRMFFERLVQVPLRVPRSAYNLDRYVKDLLKEEKDRSGEFVKVFNTLLKEPTPRAVNRHLNTMYLHWSIYGDPKNAENNSLSMLLAAAILEVENNEAFDVVAECARGDEAHFAKNLEAKLSAMNLDDGVNWAKLPALWSDGEDVEVDVAKRRAFLFWVKKLR